MARVRITSTDDVELIRELDQQCLPKDQPLVIGDEVWWVARLEKEPVAYAGVTVDGFLCRSGVLPQYRGGGLQKRLVRVRERWARRQGLTKIRTYVLASNLSSLRSLLSCGFKPTACWVSDGSTFLSVEKNLT